VSAADRDGTCGLRDRPVPLVLPDQSTTACLAFRRWTCAARAGRAQGADGWRSDLRVCALGCSMGPMVTHPEDVTSPFRSEAGCADPIDGLSASTVETEGPTPWLRSSEPPRGRLALTGSLDRALKQPASPGSLPAHRITRCFRAASTEMLQDFAEMVDTELLVIDSSTTGPGFRDRIRWNQAYYRLARGSLTDGRGTRNSLPSGRGSDGARCGGAGVPARDGCAPIPQKRGPRRSR